MKAVRYVDPLLQHLQQRVFTDRQEGEASCKVHCIYCHVIFQTPEGGGAKIATLPTGRLLAAPLAVI